MRKLFITLFAVLISTPALSFERVELCKLDTSIRNIEPDSARQDELLRSFFADKQIVAVNGYFGCSEGNFQNVRNLLRRVGIYTPVSVLCPPDGVAVENNVVFLVQNLRRLATQHPGRKIVLLGQSKGGAEVLQLLATRPEFLEKQTPHDFEIAAAVTFSASVGGSKMADLVLNLDPELKELWEKFKQENGFNESWFSQILSSLLFDPTTPGFRSLTTLSSKARSEKLLTETPESVRKLLRDKLFYVTAVRERDANDVPAFLSLITKFMMELGEPNDGLVFEKDQRLDGIGTHLLEVRRASHFSMVGSEGEPRCREELARLIFLQLAVREAR